MECKSVAGYYRVSVARDDMKAPELYRDEIERYCNYKRLQLTDVFSDIDRSGYRGARSRPGLEELKLRHLEFSAVIVPKLSRFGRSVKELVELFDLFDNNGVSLVFLDMNIDTSTSQGRLLRHIMAAFAEYESDVKADYARANHRLARSQGLPWDLPPFGYVPTLSTARARSRSQTLRWSG
jgi:DNA invertase Pin-like site-specific DNA recombinase